MYIVYNELMNQKISNIGAESIFCNTMTQQSLIPESNQTSFKNQNFCSAMNSTPTTQNMMLLSKENIELKKILSNNSKLINCYKQENQQLKRQLQGEKEMVHQFSRKIEDYQCREDKVYSVRSSLEKDFNGLKSLFIQQERNRKQLQGKSDSLVKENKNLQAKIASINSQFKLIQRNYHNVQQKLRILEEQNWKLTYELRQAKIGNIQNICKNMNEDKTNLQPNIHVSTVMKNNRSFRNKNMHQKMKKNQSTLYYITNGRAKSNSFNIPAKSTKNPTIILLNNSNQLVKDAKRYKIKENQSIRQQQFDKNKLNSNTKSNTGTKTSKLLKTCSFCEKSIDQSAKKIKIKNQKSSFSHKKESFIK